MESYSQNTEDLIVANYFSGVVRSTGGLVFCDVGANDGITLSNTRKLAELGWQGILVEPCKEAYDRLVENYKYLMTNGNFELFNLAVTKEGQEYIELYTNGEHLGKGDVGLLSTTKQTELKRWKNTKEEFTTQLVRAKTFAEILIMTPFTRIDFITIDCEGCDVEVLNQIDLKALNVKCVCVEHNGSYDAKAHIKRQCNEAGLGKQLLTNNENVIWAI